MWLGAFHHRPGSTLLTDWSNISPCGVRKAFSYSLVLKNSGNVVGAESVPKSRCPQKSHTRVA